MVKMYRKLILESGADDKYVDSTIASTFPQLQPYLNTPLAELRGIGLSVPDTDRQRYGNTRLKDYMRQSLMREFDISHGRGPAKYLRGIARVAIGELGWPDGNRGDLSKFKQYVLYIHNNEPEKFDKNLNSLSFDELRDMFRQKTKNAQRLDVEKLGRENLGKSSYRVVPIRNVGEAMRYGNYTSWCITQRSYGESNYNNYTQGGGRFYFLLKDGFENVPKRVGENCPLDEYGLSMISVLVGMEGDIEIITTRWNHEHDGENNPNLHTAEQLQHITGIRVYEVLKPYSREELHQMGIVLFDEVQDLLDSGKRPEEVFDDAGDFHDGYAPVRLNGKYNFIDTEGKIQFDQWFDYVDNFHEGYAEVQLNGKYNFTDTEGDILSPQWFDVVGNFHEGYAEVQLNGKHNFIDTEGKIQFDQWFDWAGDFHDGYAPVRLNGKYNFINKKGDILSQQWFDDAGDFHDGYAPVRLNGKHNFIDTEGKILSEQWYDSTYDFSNDFATVELNNKYNIINTEGKVLSPQWFDVVYNFHEGYAEVKLNNKYNIINTEGKVLSPQWFDVVYNFHEGYAEVQLNGKHNFIDTEGEILSQQWFDDAGDFHDGFARVKLNGKWKYLDTNGRLYNDIPRRQNNVLTEVKLRKIIRNVLQEMLV